MRKLSKSQLIINEKKWALLRTKVLAYIQEINPRIYKVLTADDFKPTKYQDLSKSSYLFGGVGTGKTVEALWMMLEWCRWRTMSSKPVRQIPLFVTCEQLFQSIRETFNSNNDMTEAQLLRQYQQHELLIIDDIGVMNTSEFTYKTLYQIVDYRYSNFLPTIYTSNLSLNELAKVLGDDRIPDRIQHDCGGRIYNYKRKSRRS